MASRFCGNILVVHSLRPTCAYADHIICYTHIREAGDEIMHKRWMRHEYELEVAVARADEL